MIEKSAGNEVFLCCGKAGKGRKFSQEQFTDLKHKIESELNEWQLNELHKLAKTWNLKYDL